MAQELSEIFEFESIPALKMIHDVVDTGNSLSLLAGVEIDYPCDGITRNYTNCDGLYTIADSTFKNHIDNGVLLVKFRTVLNGPKDSYLTYRIYVPHPTYGDIEIDEHDCVLHKNNEDAKRDWSTFVYMGTDAETKTYGFKVTITPSQNMTLKYRSICLAS